MYNLSGEFEVRLDDKNRLRMPAGLLRQLEEDIKLGMVINRGFDPCLSLYTHKLWEQKSNEVKLLSPYIRENREYARYFFRGASKVELDASSRILIPKSLMDYANFKNDLIILAYGETIEIWSRDSYEKIIANEPKDFAQFTEKVLGHKDV